MMLVYVKPENEEIEAWELPIKQAKTHELLLKRIHKYLQKEYQDKKYKIIGIFTEL